MLRELPSPGKSGSVFFVSNDERYMIKTMRKVRHVMGLIYGIYLHLTVYTW